MKKGYIYAVLSAVLFGSAGIFVKMSYATGLSSVPLLIHQYTIAVILMFLLLLILDRHQVKVSLGEFKKLMILGVVGNTFMTIFYYTAFNYLPVAMVNMLLYTCPIFVFLYSVIFNHERVTLKKILAILSAFIGCILTIGVFSGHMTYSLVGIGFAILSAVFYAFMNLYTEKYLSKIKPLKINAYATLWSLITLIIIQCGKGLFLGQNIEIFNTNLSLKSIMYITILAIACEIIPLTLLYASLGIIGAFKVSIIGNIEIPTSMILGLIFLKEGVGLIQIVGAVFIIYAAYIIKST